MKIIDFEKKGHVIRLYLGEDDCNDYWGDDWDDAPYEHNAGVVYEKYVKGTLDIAVPFDCFVEEPADDWNYNGNSRFAKEDFQKERAPFLVITKDSDWSTCYSSVVGDKNAMKLYFNQPIDDAFQKTLSVYGIVTLRKENRNI